MTKFIKSSVRTKPDPLYYKRKIDRWQPQRDAMFAVVEAREEETGVEDVAGRLAIERLSAKIVWAIRCLVPAMRMRDAIRQGLDPYTGRPVKPGL